MEKVISLRDTLKAQIRIWNMTIYEDEHPTSYTTVFDTKPLDTAETIYTDASIELFSHLDEVQDKCKEIIEDLKQLGEKTSPITTLNTKPAVSLKTETKDTVRHALLRAQIFADVASDLRTNYSSSSKTQRDRNYPSLLQAIAEQVCDIRFIARKTSDGDIVEGAGRLEPARTRNLDALTE
jgi:hypothetical protein